MRAALNHLKKSDPILAAIIARTGPCKMSYREPSFEALVRAITFQQLNGRAALTIYNRLVEAAGGTITPESIQDTSVGAMRRAGLSKQKITYIRDLAEHATEGSLDFAALPNLSDDEAIAALTQVKGVGEWTAHMFLMFALRRPNVLPTGDFGVRTAIRKAYKKRYKTKDGLPSPAHMKKLAKAWHPYCSVASWYLWRSLESTPEI